MIDKKYEAVLIKMVSNNLKEGKFSKEKIKADLAARNVPEGQIEQLYQLGFDQYEKRNAQLKFVFLGLGIGILCILLFAIPISFNGMGAGFLFLIGAGLVSYLLNMAIPMFGKSEDNRPEQKRSQWRMKYMIVFMFGAIILGGALFISHGMKESHQISSDGIQVEGIIIDGSSFRVKRTTTYSLDVKFQTLELEEINTAIDVSEWEFNNSAKNQRILLEYSKSDPYLVRLAKGVRE